MANIPIDFKAQVIAALDSFISVAVEDDVRISLEGIEFHLRAALKKKLSSNWKSRTKITLRSFVSQQYLEQDENDNYLPQQSLLDLLSRRDSRATPYVDETGSVTDEEDSEFYKLVAKEMDKSKDENESIRIDSDLPSSNQHFTRSNRKRRRTNTIAHVSMPIPQIIDLENHVERRSPRQNGRSSSSATIPSNTPDVIIVTDVETRTKKRPRQSDPGPKILQMRSPNISDSRRRTLNFKSQRQRRQSLPVSRASLLPENHQGQTVMQFIPLAATLDSRTRRRLQRTNLSAEMNSLGEQGARRSKDSRLEIERLRKIADRTKILEKEKEILEVQQQHESAKVSQLEEELFRMKRELEEISLSQITIDPSNQSRRHRSRSSLSVIGEMDQDEDMHNDIDDYNGDMGFDTMYQDAISDDEDDDPCNNPSVFDALPVTQSTPYKDFNPEVADLISIDQHDIVDDQFSINLDFPPVEAESISQLQEQDIAQIDVLYEEVREKDREIKLLLQKQRTTQVDYDMKVSTIEVLSSKNRDLLNELDQEREKVEENQNILNSITKEKIILEAQLEDASASVSVLRRQLLTVENQRDEAQSSSNLSIMDKNAIIAAKQAQIEDLITRLESSQTINNHRSKELAEIETQVRQMGDILEELRLREESLRSEKTLIEEEKEALRERLADMTAKSSELEQVISERNAKVQSLEDAVKIYNTDRTRFAAEIENLSASNGNLSSKINDLTIDMDAIIQENQDRVVEVESSTGRLLETSKALDDAKALGTSLVDKNDALSVALQSCTIEISALKDNVNDLTIFNTTTVANLQAIQADLSQNQIIYTQDRDDWKAEKEALAEQLVLVKSGEQRALGALAIEKGKLEQMKAGFSNHMSNFQQNMWALFQTPSDPVEEFHDSTSGKKRDSGIGVAVEEEIMMMA